MSKGVLIIDLQNAVFDGRQIPPAHDAQRLLENASALLHAARQAGVPVIHIQHCAPAGEALEEGGPGWPIYAPLAPRDGEPVVRKRFASAFEETDLEATLQGLDVRTLIVTGIQSEQCVAAACRAALTLGYGVYLAQDTALGQIMISRLGRSWPCRMSSSRTQASSCVVPRNW